MTTDVAEELGTNKNIKLTLTVSLLGDFGCGRKCLITRYVEDKYDADYHDNLRTMFMEKTISLKNVDVAISLCYLTGQREYINLLPIVCCDAKVILFVFDLTQKLSLFSTKRWYKEARKENKIFIPFLIGAKYDLFAELDTNYKMDITKQARKFAKKLYCPLIYCSSKESINIRNIFKLMIAKVFDLKSKIKERCNEREEALIEDWSKFKNDGCMEYLVYGYIRENEKLCLLNIPHGIIEICFLFYYSTESQSTKIEKLIGKTMDIKDMEKKKKKKKKKKKIKKMKKKKKKKKKQSQNDSNE